MESEGELQSLINRIVEESGKIGMMVNIEKTEVQHVGPERVNIEIKIRSQKLKQVQDCVYLGEQWVKTRQQNKTSNRGLAWHAELCRI